MVQLFHRRCASGCPGCFEGERQQAGYEKSHSRQHPHSSYRDRLRIDPPVRLAPRLKAGSASSLHFSGAAWRARATSLFKVRQIVREDQTMSCKSNDFSLGARLCAILLATSALSGWAFTQTITLSTKAGPPTAHISVGGSGFPANSAVDVYFDLSELALAVTDSTGAFSKVTIQAPKSALPGIYLKCRGDYGSSKQRFAHWNRTSGEGQFRCGRWPTQGFGWLGWASTSS